MISKDFFQLQPHCCFYDGCFQAVTFKLSFSLHLSILNKNNVKSNSSSIAHNARNFNKEKDNAHSSPLREENTYVRMHYSLITKTKPQNMTLCNIKHNLIRKETAHYRQLSKF